MLTEQSTKPTPTGAGCLPVCVSKEGQLLVLVHTTTRGKKMGQLIDFGGGIYEDDVSLQDLPFVWRRYLEEDSEEWHTYKAWEALPQRPEDYRGLVLTGSHHCSFDVDVPWITALKAYVADCVANQRTRLLGGCFGCQLIARACGGEVTRNLGGSFIFRPERIEVDLKAVQSLPYYEYGLEKEPMFLQGARDAQTITAMEVHGDSVISLPPGAIRLGHSPTSPNELYAIGHTALASQSHPEFSVGLMLKDLAPLVIKRGSVPPTELGSSLEAIAGPLGRGPQQLLQLYRAFLKAPSKE